MRSAAGNLHTLAHQILTVNINSLVSEEIYSSSNKRHPYLDPSGISRHYSMLNEHIRKPFLMSVCVSDA